MSTSAEGPPFNAFPGRRVRPETLYRANGPHHNGRAKGSVVAHLTLNRCIRRDRRVLRARESCRSERICQQPTTLINLFVALRRQPTAHIERDTTQGHRPRPNLSTSKRTNLPRLRALRVASTCEEVGRVDSPNPCVREPTRASWPTTPNLALDCLRCLSHGRSRDARARRPSHEFADQLGLVVRRTPSPTTDAQRTHLPR